MIRGDLLAIAARKNKEHQALVLSLSDMITKLEAQHKCSRATQEANELADTQSLLLGELFKRARRRHVLSTFLADIAPSLYLQVTGLL